MGSYYLNSLRSWKANLQEQLRAYTSLHVFMEKMSHPDLSDQSKLIDLNKEFIAKIDDEIFDVEDSESHVPTGEK